MSKANFVFAIMYIINLELYTYNENNNMDRIQENYINGNISRAVKDFIEQGRELKDLDMLDMSERVVFAQSIINELQ